MVDIAPERQSEEEEPLASLREDSRVRIWLRRIALALGAFLLLPYALTILYAPSFTHPISTLMLADLALFRGYERQWVPLDRISPVLVKSVMMSEDGQFCVHNGVDWVQMRGVVEDAMQGEPTRGASTIAMQTSKNLFLWNSRSFIRKGLEVPIALWVDLIWSKKRVMEVYLNIAEWGPGIYGIEAAARHYFHVPASSLTSRQASLLAVALPNPFTRIASKPGRGMQRLAMTVQARARASGDYIKCLYP